MIKIKNLLNFLWDKADKISLLVYSYMFAIVLPLYYANTYYDMLEAKAKCFMFLSYIFVPLLFITAVQKLINKSIVWDKLSLLILIFGVFCLFSTFTSYDIKNSFSGLLGWGVGGWSIFFMCLSFVVFRGTIINQKFLIPIAITHVLIIVLVILHDAGLDLLSMHEGIKKSMRYKFVSTIGNINWAVGYFSIITPFVIYKFMENKSIFWGLFTGITIFASLLLGSDGLYIAYAVMIPLIVWKFYTKENVRKFCLLLLLSGISILIINNLSIFAKCRGAISGLSDVILNNNIAFLFLALSLICFLFGKRFSGKTILILYLLLCVVFVAVFTITPLSKILEPYRMLMWKEGIRCFVERFPLKMKLLGIGPELCLNIYSKLTTQQMELITSPHSEYMQVFLSLGIIGSFLYLLTLLNMFSVFKNDHLLFTITACYLSQSLVNSATVTNLMLLSVFIVLQAHPKIWK